MLLETIIGVLGTALIGTLAWAAHLDNRVIIVETEQKGLRELINARFDGVNTRLDRIERAMNGHLKDEKHD